MADAGLVVLCAFVSPFRADRKMGRELVSPGEFYGDAATGHVRVAVVQPDDRIALVAQRLTG